MSAVGADRSSAPLIPVAQPALTEDQKVRNHGKQIASQITTLAKESLLGFSAQERKDLQKLGDKIRSLLKTRDTAGLKQCFNLPIVQRLTSLRLFPDVRDHVLKTPAYQPNLRSMHPIIDGFLYLGGVKAYNLLQKTGITHVVKVSHEPSTVIRVRHMADKPSPLPQGITEFDLPLVYNDNLWQVLLAGLKLPPQSLDDSSLHQDAFKELFYFIDTGLGKGQTVLIDCSDERVNSQGYSLILGSAYLISRFKIPIKQAVAYLMQLCPDQTIFFPLLVGLEKTFSPPSAVKPAAAMPIKKINNPSGDL